MEKIKWKILDLYAGIGGNRKLWGDNYEITAVENVKEIANIYHDFFPKDTIVVADAHQYLLDHYKEYDFIWSSPPCPTHSRFNLIQEPQGMKIRYPDMALYQEIILLQKWFKGKYCVENVITYYKPLIAPQEVNNHYYWANFLITPVEKTTRHIRRQKHDERLNRVGFNLKKFNLKRTFEKQVINNCVEPELGEHILNCALGKQKQKPLI